MRETERILITGFSGFVSRHFLDYLESMGTAFEVLGVDLNAPEFPLDRYRNVHCVFRPVNLLDKNECEKLFSGFRPQYILHLASISSVGYSWTDPVGSFANNTNIFLHLLDQVRRQNIPCRILSVGSSEEYGNVSSSMLPIREETPLQPLSPYAVARVSQEMLSRVFYKGYGMDIVLTRSFNHIGPYQKDVFVVSSFAKKITECKKKQNGKGVIETGDLSIVRDFVDVRDVVKAYYALFKKGKSGEVYNICSGIPSSLESILDKLAQLAGVKIEKKTTPSLIRPDDNRVIIGSYARLESHTGWKPGISLEKSLKDILDYYSAL